ncbi:MAG: PEP-CTERM sorting domain-containing protein [Fimbriimonadaceae bacterium]|jgi:hypothetical protein|nr:PEP-CTERM sorting domain-containing protein [Fimbriimonadaceae bacterium]
MKKFFGLIALAVGSMAVASAQTFTVATFDDPSAGATTQYFQFAPTTAGDVFGNTGVLFGQWGSMNLTLDVPAFAALGLGSASYSNARFVMTDDANSNTALATANAISFTGGVQNAAAANTGWIRFFTGDGNPVGTSNELFRIRFTGARYNVLSVGAAELIFTGPASDVSFWTPGNTQISGLRQESFAFSFANFSTTQNPGNLAMTAAFTSSAVPEPMTMGLIALGAAGLAARRRNRKS